MTGADEAHYLCASGTSSRLVAFPDGIARHITLKNWYWEVLDRLEKEKGWSADEVPAAALQVASESEDPTPFEERLRRIFSVFVRLNMPGVMREREDLFPANEDDPSASTPILTLSSLFRTAATAPSNDAHP